jgi:hypothetical protein
MLVKEIALAGEDGAVVFVVKLPRHLKPAWGSKHYITNRWLHRKHHIPTWVKGRYTLTEVIYYLQEHLKEKIYAKGDEKCRLLSDLLGVPVDNLESLGCPSLGKLGDFDHESHIHHHCPVYKAFKLYTWLSHHDEEEEG